MESLRDGKARTQTFYLTEMKEERLFEPRYCACLLRSEVKYLQCSIEANSDLNFLLLLLLLKKKKRKIQLKLLRQSL